MTADQTDLYIDVTVENGKYRVIMPHSGGLKALRYGEEWRDCLGDNLIYYLALELQEAREELAKLKGAKE